MWPLDGSREATAAVPQRELAGWESVQKGRSSRQRLPGRGLGTAVRERVCLTVTVSADGF